MSDRVSSGTSGSRSSAAPNKPSKRGARGGSPASNVPPVVVKAPSSIHKAKTPANQPSETKVASPKLQSSGDMQKKKSAMHKPARIIASGVNDHQTFGAPSRPISKKTENISPSSKKLPSTQIKMSGPVSAKVGIREKTSHDKRVVGGSGNVTAVFGNKELDDSSALSTALIKQARQSGQLNLSDRNLSFVPSRVWRINEPDKDEQTRINKGLSLDRIEEDSWWEHVDLNKLILASNQITEISSDIQLLLGLTVLDLHDNHLRSLPEEIGQLENLTKLNLNHNQLVQLPMKFYDMRNLRTLTICHNKMADVSDELCRLDMLEYLDLSHNDLITLPSGLGYLTKCTKVVASHNKLKALPSEIGLLRSVHLLDLSHNELENTPDSMQDFQQLEQLYLHHNKLKQLPNLKNCCHLKELFLGYNKIEDITEENIENTANQIKILDMRDNKLKVLPDEIINLQSLERLDVTNNDLSSLPFALGTLPHIKSLLVDGNPMKSIRRDIIQRGTVGLLKYLRMRIDDDELIRLREKGSISPVASTISGSPPIPDKHTMKSAQMMNMSKKEIASLPDEAVANALEADVNGVDLSQNHLAEFPTNLEPLIDKLFELNLSHNKISKDLPGSILAQGKNLQYLNLSNNRLEKLPSEIGELANLREICLSFNKFDCIPASLQTCEKLETLLLNGNQIKVIDVEGLSRLKRLAILDLSNNDINQVPPELGKLTQLKTLQLEGNAFRVPRPDILVKGTQSIMCYLRDRIPR